MAIVLKDRVKVSSGIVGTGTVALGSAATGYQDFSAIGNGNVTYYTIALQSGSEWEVGQGTVTQVTGVWYLSRDVVLESSNANTLVNFTIGTKDVFVTYPAEKAIYEEASGNVIFDGGPITVVGTGVTSYASFANFFAEMFGDANTYVQQYIQNQNDGSDASADYVALNDIGTDTTYYVDMGMNSSGYSSGTFQIYTPNSGYVYAIGGGTTAKMFVGSADDDLILHAGGFATTNIGLTVSGTDQTVAIAKDATIGGTASVTGAADFASTVLLSANPTLALQAATKQYVDNQVAAGIHIHDPVLVETDANLTASYTQGGTTFNITDITGTKTLTTSVNHGLSLNDQIWLYNTAGNGLSTNTAYFVYSTPALNQITVSVTFGNSELTGLTNATGLAYNTRANSGVGSKLTNSGTQIALTIDNVALALTNRVMVRSQTNPEENGVYTVTTVGSGATNWELTRATDSNRVNPSDPNGVGTGDYYYTQDGDLNAGNSYVLTTEPNTMIIGYTDLTYTQFSGAVTYVGVAPIDVTGQLISLTGTVAATNGGTGTNTVSTGNLLYGTGTNTWSKLPIGAAYKPLLVNAGGTNVEWNALAVNQAGTVSGALPIAHGGTNITTYTLGDTLYSSATNTLAKLAGSISTTKVFLTQTGTGAVSAAPAWGTISAADVSGLATSATTDTTNAANITSGTLPTGRLNGSYTGITGVGTLAAGTWNGGTIAAIYGGTGISSYTTGDLLYASSSTAISKLADVVTGNALISGGVGTAPTWGQIGLTTHVSGTLAVGNGGTGATTLSGYVYGNGTGAMTASTSIPNSATTATSANTASTIVARDASGNFTAGTITAALNGNASTATTAANVNDGTLSLAVSGTGLSGSATFTANQSGNSSFTVTSNATSANTASTIVARDASGNFTAGTITAALSGNATTATSAISAGTATSLAAGVAGAVPYQSGAGATGFSAAGSSGQYLQSNGTSAPSWITPPTIGNGTLTMNVSGVGLSGSQTFTANQAGAGTFTVTSNATSANTASAIVARDASGNFSAGTITASLSGNATTATNATTAANLTTGTAIKRTVAGAGYLDGMYAGAESTTTSGAIYSIGGAYVPGTTTLGNMYGIGYGYSGNAGITATGVGANLWGMYVASGGVSRIFLDADNGRGFFNSSVYAGGTLLTGNTGTVTSVTGTGSYGGLTLSGTVTTSGNLTFGGTPTGTWPITVTGGAATAVNLSTTRTDWSTNGTISAVVGQLAWKNYGNSHTIFDASASTAPDGTAVNNANAAVAWTGTYPTLMGWNGGSTYGVRVDSARISDSTSGNAATITSQANSATITASTAVNGNQIVLRDANGDDYRRYGFASYFNMNHGVSGTTTDTIFYSSGDDYIRKNNATGFRASLNVPTRTGGDASGTWSISISGNAATAGTATSATTANNVTGIVAVANGGTGATTAAAARTNLGAGTGNGTVTSVGGTGGYNGLTLSGTVTGSGNLTLGGSPSGTWPISVTGSAFSASTATTAISAGTCTGNSATATKLSTASGTAPSYSSRAWVNFNGTGTVVILASQNVSSITDSGVGNYTVNLITAMQDANYAVATGGQGYTPTPTVALQGPCYYSLTTSSFVLATGSNTNGAGDWPSVSASVFR